MSSLVMVPAPVPSANVALVPVALVTLTEKVSLLSLVVSPFTNTLKVYWVCPSAMLAPVAALVT